LDLTSYNVDEIDRGVGDANARLSRMPITHQKALSINLDDEIYGAIAKIGASETKQVMAQVRAAVTALREASRAGREE